MADQWYYSWGEGVKEGPFTAVELRALADSGKIQPSDTVWKDGMEQGVPAGRVRNLFPESEANPGETPSELESVQEENVSSPEEAPKQPDSGTLTEGSGPAVPEQEAAKPQPPPEGPKKKKGRATVVRGAHITAQDGSRVQFRKKCITCGYEDTSKASIPLRMGTTRMSFFCRKCRKLKPVEIFGSG
jgi:hypothetical protein